MTAQEAIRRVLSDPNKENIREAILRPEIGRWLYEVRFGKGKNPQSVLIDAQNGKVLSPINDTLAADFAKQYVAEPGTVESVEFLEEFVHRSGKQYKDVAKISFREKHGTTIFLDRNSGRILEEEDKLRRFHFMVMQLHTLNFFGSKKRLTVIPGGLLFLMTVSGLWMWASYRKARMKKIN